MSILRGICRPCAVLCFAALTVLLRSAPAEETFHAGYTRFEFTSPLRPQQSQRVSVFLWHPTASEEQPYVYRWQKGSVALQARVAPGRHPLVLFSHGYLGAGDQALFLMEALARAGCIVAAPNHLDAQASGRGFRELPGFAKPESWTDQKFLDRRQDLAALLDHLLALDAQSGSWLHGRIDRRAIGGAGHSLGGYTMLGMAGAWDTWRDERIRAVLLLSPYAQPFLSGDSLPQVQVPVMLQGGTLDFGITPFLPGAYRKLSAPKYSLTLAKATHFEWTNILSADSTTTECVKSGNAKLITDYSLAFFDRHLRGKEMSAVLDAKQPGLANYEHVK